MWELRFFFKSFFLLRWRVNVSIRIFTTRWMTSHIFTMTRELIFFFVTTRMRVSHEKLRRAWEVFLTDDEDKDSTRDCDFSLRRIRDRSRRSSSSFESDDAKEVSIFLFRSTSDEKIETFARFVEYMSLRLDREHDRLFDFCESSSIDCFWYLVCRYSIQLVNRLKMFVWEWDWMYRVKSRMWSFKFDVFEWFAVFISRMIVSNEIFTVVNIIDASDIDETERRTIVTMKKEKTYKASTK